MYLGSDVDLQLIGMDLDKVLYLSGPLRVMTDNIHGTLGGLHVYLTLKTYSKNSWYLQGRRFDLDFAGHLTRWKQLCPALPSFVRGFLSHPHFPSPDRAYRTDTDAQAQGSESTLTNSRTDCLH